MPPRPLAAIILAAGKGTRMKSDLPKVLHPVLGRPLGSYPVSRVLELGVSPCVVVIGHGADQVREGLGSFGGRLTFAVQAERLGTGHATRMASEALARFQGDVLILPGDAPLIRLETLKNLVETHRKEHATLTLLTTERVEPASYGRVLRGPDSGLEAIVEYKDASSEVREIREINSGIYVVDATFLFPGLARIGKQNAQGEYYLTDIVGLARDAGVVRRIHCHPVWEELAGVNTVEELASAEAWLRAVAPNQADPSPHPLEA